MNASPRLGQVGEADPVQIVSGEAALVHHGFNERDVAGIPHGQGHAFERLDEGLRGRLLIASEFLDKVKPRLHSRSADQDEALELVGDHEVPVLREVLPRRRDADLA